MTQPIVFIDIAGPDDEMLKIFYRTVFGWEIDQAGQFIAPITAPLKGSIRRDPAEQRLYLGVTDVNATLKDVVSAGGTINKPCFEVPGVVVLGLFEDPAGNPMGLVEIEGDRPRIP